MNWASKTILITGSTGSFGHKFIEVMLHAYQPKKLIIFSRGEARQHEMRMEGFNHSSLRYFIGDVRDLPRLRRAMSGVDFVVHAGALKQVPACEYNPFEAIKTNILGSQNVIEAAIDCDVEKVLAISSDKAVNPVNLYGATKLVMEKLFVQGNVYSGGGTPHFSCVRYGNVIGSQGSVIPVFQKQRGCGTITVTDERMTRFWLTLEHGVRVVIWCLENMKGGEIFVPKIPSMSLVDVAKAIAPECKIEFIGIRPGEKLHEILISDPESRHAVELDNMYVIQPVHSWGLQSWEGEPLPDGFKYTSDTNEWRLTIEELQECVCHIS